MSLFRNCDALRLQIAKAGNALEVGIHYYNVCNDIYGP